MALGLPAFARRIFAPPAALPVVCRPNRRWSRGAAAGLLRLKVAEVVVETPSTRTFVFDHGGLAYAAGQHVTLLVEIDGRTHRRCYSFSSSPSAGTRPSITVKRVEGGVLSGWLHDHVRPGDELRALPVSGSFVAGADASHARHCVMVAGGVGITPIVSMSEEILRTEPGSRVTLVYGSRREDEIIFRTRLEDLARATGGRLRLVLALDEAGEGWTGLAGALDADRVIGALGERAVDEWFLCGPRPMMDGLTAMLDRSGVPAGRVHLERFEYAEAAATAIPTAPATLVFAASAVTATAPAGTTILEAAEKAGIALPSSCRMGGCGACKVKVDGRVVGAEPSCLTPAERAEGYALACCSWADGHVTLPDF
jgi:ferredoxin-NADP reductase